MKKIASFSILLAAASTVYAAQQPWSKDPAQWTPADAQHILSNSPWAQPAIASFASVEADNPPPPGPMPGQAQAGMAGPNGATDGRWDGGVGRMPRGGEPTLPITIRWDSALPVREAFAHVSARNASGPSDGAQRAAKDYVITVLGLVPSGRYRTAGQLPTKSRSDEDSEFDPQDPEQMLEGLMADSRLTPRNQKPIRPDDVKLDASTGVLHLFFPRSEGIDLKDKEVTFTTRFGSMTIQKQFRLKEMVYQGKLEL